MKLSVVLATRNEEKNIANCLDSVKHIADEIIVVDEKSEDNTRKIAEDFGAKVIEVEHKDIFHINKQKALSLAKGDWVLQLDADEVVTPQLAKEIIKVTNLNYQQLIDKFDIIPQKKKELFIKHQDKIEQKLGKTSQETGEVVAFFVPRKNYFLGKPLIHAGVYPDGAIRLIKRGKARFPAKSVHELMQIDGEVSWLTNDLIHNDSPTFGRYIERMNRYTSLESKDYSCGKNVGNLIHFSFVKPFLVFLNLYLRHRGFMDGTRGFIWSLFSALHYPVSFFKYWID